MQCDSHGLSSCQLAVLAQRAAARAAAAAATEIAVTVFRELGAGGYSRDPSPSIATDHRRAAQKPPRKKSQGSQADWMSTALKVEPPSANQATLEWGRRLDMQVATLACMSQVLASWTICRPLRGSGLLLAATHPLLSALVPGL